MTNFRKLNNDDDINQIAKWIYKTDNTLFDKLFSCEADAIESIKKLIMSDYVNPFHRDFIVVLYTDNPKLIDAISVAFKGSYLSVEDTFNAFVEAGCSNVDSMILFEKLSIIFSLYIKYNDYYLACLYVDKKSRKKYVASKLVEKVKQNARQSHSNNLLVNYNFQKSSLSEFYEKLDFEKSTKTFHWLFKRKYGYYTMIYKIK